MKAAFLSCLLIVFVLAPACFLDAQEEEGAPSEELWWTPYVEHLNSFGYETEVSEGRILTLIPPEHNLWLEHSELGVLTTTFYTFDSGNANDATLCETINTVNSNAVVSRTFMGENETLVIEGFYAAEYDRDRFAAFLDKLHAEMTGALMAWSNWAESEPTIE
jgi:hypothetical protein